MVTKKAKNISYLDWALPKTLKLIRSVKNKIKP